MLFHTLVSTTLSLASPVSVIAPHCAVSLHPPQSNSTLPCPVSLHMMCRDAAFSLGDGFFTSRPPPPQSAEPRAGFPRTRTCIHPPCRERRPHSCLSALRIRPAQISSPNPSSAGGCADHSSVQSGQFLSDFPASSLERLDPVAFLLLSVP